MPRTGIYDQFVEKLSKKVAAMKIGDGTEAGVTQGPLINMDAIDKVEKHIADAVKGGAKIVTGGKRHALGGSFFEPTVLSNVAPDALVAHEETFGPLAPVFRFKDEADVIAMCNNSPFGLASYFYSRDLGRVWRVAEALESGMVGVNTGLITTEVAPFGGVKESGLGPRRLASRHGRICRDQIRDDGGDLAHSRRPGERRGPYPRRLRSHADVGGLASYERRWLWVPAFAGTTSGSTAAAPRWCDWRRSVARP